MIGSSLKISVDKRMETINSDGNLKMAKKITNVNKRDINTGKETHLKTKFDI